MWYLYLVVASQAYAITVGSLDYAPTPAFLAQVDSFVSHIGVQVWILVGLYETLVGF